MRKCFSYHIKRRNTNKRESVVWLKFLNDMRTPPSMLVRNLAVGKLKTPSDKRHKCTIEYGMKNSPWLSTETV